MLAVMCCLFPSHLRLPLTSDFLAFAVLCPSRQRGAAKYFAAFLRADIAPSCGAQAERSPPDWRWRQLSRSNINDFKCQIEQHFWREACLAYHRSQSLTAACPESMGQLRAQCEV